MYFVFLAVCPIFLKAYMEATALPDKVFISGLCSLF